MSERGIAGSEGHCGGKNSRRVLALGAAAIVALALIAGVALAATGDLTPRGCIADVGDVAGCGTTEQGLDGAFGVAVSPDGKSAYVVSISDDAIVRFDRDTTTGALTAQGCIADPPDAAGCGASQQGLAGANGVAVSPDGKSVYVASGADDTIARFDRDTTTGALTPQGCIADGGDSAGCGTADQGLDGAEGVAVSPDGKSVYVVSEFDGAIVRFDRDSTTGALTPQGCIADSPDSIECGASQQGLAGALDVAVSPDGRSVYVASINDDAIVRFERDTTTGEISGQDCIADPPDAAGCGTTTEQGLDGANGVAVSPDGESVYVASRNDDAIARFDRDTTTGALGGQGCIEDPDAPDAGCGTTQQGLNFVNSIAVSADGNSAYAASAIDDAIARFDRDTTTGAISGRGCIADVGDGAGCGATEQGLDGAFGVDTSPDGRSVYVAGNSDDAIARFDRELPDTIAPTITLKGNGTQKSSKFVKVKVNVGEAAEVTGSGMVKVPLVKGSARAAKSKRSRLKPQSESLAANETAILKLKLKKKARKLTRKAQRKGKKAKAKVTVIATDAAGNKSSAKRKLKLKGKRK
jgi:sugar lactone lactonase YvrE